MPASPLPRLALAVGLLLAYWLVSLRHLQSVPPVYEDEPWQASTGWKIAVEGVFGSDLFAGLNGMERHYYGYAPLHPLLLAGFYRLLGLGLWQTRLEPVALGCLALALTFALGRRLFDGRVGLLAVALLIGVRTAGATRYQVTGVVFLDYARIARYDMLVPVLGLAALHAWLTGTRRRAAGVRWHALAGLLAGLAGLSHLYGVFWLPVLAVLTGWEGVAGTSPSGGMRLRLTALLVGFTLPWLGYSAYVAAGWGDFLQQIAGYGDRFDVLNPLWYWRNLLAEPSRYGPGLGPPGWHYLLRPGVWLAALVVPAALGVLAWRAIASHDPSARALAVPVFGMLGLFALLVSSKVANYAVAFFPLLAVAAAWLAVWAWRWSRSRPGRGWLRVALLGACAALLVEAAGRLVVLEQAGAATTSYAAYTSRIRALADPPARTLGLHTFWLGLAGREYVGWLVPILQAQATSEPRAAAVTSALDGVAPEVVLLDARMLDYLEAASYTDETPAAILKWLARGYVRVGAIDDPTYGRTEVYRAVP